ncbi:hypothetical protein [Nonomuraea guangzhouensis]|uniref:Uncharacterized protein n=1 Tax=Nonomuraea guangzhouensis TaxID=1291555 RepID=A0ABW4G4K9_9ACTN|nr:hypothetical protein [Nonomuraea guangzhouensis]
MPLIPGPAVRGDGGLQDIATAGGLHAYQLRLHAEYGPVVPSSIRSGPST